MSRTRFKVNPHYRPVWPNGVSVRLRTNVVLGWSSVAVTYPEPLMKLNVTREKNLTMTSCGKSVTSFPLFMSILKQCGSRIPEA